MPSGFVYILASKRNGTLYIGVTSDLHGRMQAHREGQGSAFVKKYGVWAAAGFEDTELGVLLEPEVGHGTTEVYAGVQA